MANIELKRNVCENCGSNLKYDPSSRMLKCSVCGRYFLINPVKTMDEMLQNYKASECPNCGANLRFDTTLQIAMCDHCDTSYNVVEEETDIFDMDEDYDYLDSYFDSSTSSIDKIVPFAVTENIAKKVYIDWAAKQSSLPLDFFKEVKSSYFKGIYMPMYNCNLHYYTEFNYEAGYYQYRTVWEHKQVYENGHYRYADVPSEKRETYYVPASGSTYGDYRYKVNGSKHINEYSFFNIASFIGGIKEDKIVPFDSRYLSGYSSLPFDVDPKTGFNEKDLEKAIVKNIEANMDGERGLFGPVYRNLRYRYSKDISRISYLLPVYVAKLKYKDKNIIAFIDGATPGRIIGTTPKTNTNTKWIVIVLLMLSILALDVYSVLFCASLFSVTLKLIGIIMAILSFLFAIPMLVYMIKNLQFEKKSIKKSAEEAKKHINEIFSEESTDISNARLTKGVQLYVESNKKAIPSKNKILFIISAILCIASFGFSLFLSFSAVPYERYRAVQEKYSNASSVESTEPTSEAVDKYKSYKHIAGTHKNVDGSIPPISDEEIYGLYKESTYNRDLYINISEDFIHITNGTEEYDLTYEISHPEEWLIYIKTGPYESNSGKAFFESLTFLFVPYRFSKYEETFNDGEHAYGENDYLVFDSITEKENEPGKRYDFNYYPWTGREGMHFERVSQTE